MKIHKYLLLVVFFVIAGCVEDYVTEPSTSNDRSNNNLGDPHKINVVSVPDDETRISFGVIADPHCDASYAGWIPFYDHDYRDTDHVVHNRHTEHYLNIDTNADCLGIIQLGDAVSANNTQNLIAFRQIWENDYPGHDGGSIAGVRDDNYHCYSAGYRINRPVFLTLGNHDIPTYKHGDKNWNQVATYIRRRIDGADGIISYFGYGAYAWRWGKYFCIQLGTWAGAGRDEGSFCQDKLDWLENLLADHVGDSNLGVLIFQHYGWDGFSREHRWWTSEDRNKELNILCRRENTSDPANPYNVLGIFTGHNHYQDRAVIHLGQDVNGNDVSFDNIQFMSSGVLNHHQYGFSIVTLTGTELKIHTKNVHKDKWSTYTKPIQVGR